MPDTMITPTDAAFEAAQDQLRVAADQAESASLAALAERLTKRYPTVTIVRFDDDRWDNGLFLHPTVALTADGTLIDFGTDLAGELEDVNEALAVFTEAHFGFGAHSPRLIDCRTRTVYDASGNPIHIADETNRIEEAARLEAFYNEPAL